MAYKDFILDKRILQRNIDKGIVESKQFDSLVSALPDRADNVAITSLEDEDLDDDIDDMDADESTAD